MAARELCTRHAFDGCAGDGGTSCAHCPGDAEYRIAARQINARATQELADQMGLLRGMLFALPFAIASWAGIIALIVHAYRAS